MRLGRAVLSARVRYREIGAPSCRCSRRGSYCRSDVIQYSMNNISDQEGGGDRRVHCEPKRGCGEAAGRPAWSLPPRRGPCACPLEGCPELSDFAIAAVGRAAQAQQQHRAAPWPPPQPAPSDMAAATAQRRQLLSTKANSSKAMASRAASTPAFSMLMAFIGDKCTPSNSSISIY